MKFCQFIFKTGLDHTYITSKRGLRPLICWQTSALCECDETITSSLELLDGVRKNLMTRNSRISAISVGRRCHIRRGFNSLVVQSKNRVRVLSRNLVIKLLAACNSSADRILRAKAKMLL